MDTLGEMRWTDAVVTATRSARARAGPCLIGVLPGEGIGSEVTGAALGLLPALEAGGVRFQTRTGGAIGRDAELQTGRSLTQDVIDFCGDVFGAGGAVLAGPGGGRFVYDLRRRFDLFCKISPLRPSDALGSAGRLKASALRGTDILVVRENASGEYLGETRDHAHPDEGRVCEHTFRYSEREVSRIADAAASLAARRRRRLAVVVKDGGLPGMTALWRDVAGASAARADVEATFLNVDLAAFLLVQEPRRFDVVVAGNLFGDVLADVGGLLLGSRGLAYSGNFASDGAAVYQTNHGGASDIAGEDRANPIGQIFSLAMMLRETFGLAREAAWIEEGVEAVVGAGFRTFDIAEEGAPIVGTREMGERVADAVGRLARSDARSSFGGSAEVREGPAAL